MAINRPRPPALFYRLRTDGPVLEYKGSHAGGVELLFVELPDALARRKMLDRLEKAHAKLLAREAGPELDAEQQTAAQVATLAVPGGQVHPISALPSLRQQVDLIRRPLPRECSAPDAPGGRHEFGRHGGACRHCGVPL